MQGLKGGGTQYQLERRKSTREKVQVSKVSKSERVKQNMFSCGSIHKHDVKRKFVSSPLQMTKDCKGSDTDAYIDAQAIANDVIFEYADSLPDTLGKVRMTFFSI